MTHSGLSMIRDEIRALAPYHVADAAGMIKLDAMENPYQLPEALRRELASRLAECPVNRYPDGGAASLRTRIGAVMGVPADCDLLLGNGSDELIQILALACARPGAVLLAPEPTFVMYAMIARFAGLGYRGVALRRDFSLDVDAMLAAIAEHRPALLFLARPNNPTGNLFDREAVDRIIDAAPGLVVLDEAYFPFAGDSYLHDLRAGSKVLVLRTFSKQGLAGLRLGFLVGDRILIAELDKLRLPYNISSLTQTFAHGVLGHFDLLLDQATTLREDRDRLAEQIAALPGVEVFPSAANFILLRLSHPSAPAVHAGLLARRILVKCLDGGHPQLAGCLRVTVGTAAENEALLAALGQLLSPEQLP